MKIKGLVMTTVVFAAVAIAQTATAAAPASGPTSAQKTQAMTHASAFTSTAKRIQGTPMTQAQVRAAVKETGGSVVTAANSLCWYYWFGYGTSLLKGRTNVHWCTNDGKWVSYANSGCYGSSSYPTYKYEGCYNDPNYGKGWNLYQVYTQWTLCYAWVPIWSNCIGSDHPHEQYQFLANGGILWNGGS